MFALAALLGVLITFVPVGANVLNDDPPPLIQPDIIITMVDDLGYIDDDRLLSRLPNISQFFLQNGLRLTQMYNENPWCCPARANFFTGLHTHNTGVIDVTHPNAFDPSRTIATALHDAGYYTAMEGKYLNNVSALKKKWPIPGWDRMDASSDRVNGRRDSSFYSDGVYNVQPGQWDIGIGKFAVDAIKNAPLTQPLFLDMAPRGPHKVGGKTDWITWVAPDKVNDPQCANIPPFEPPSYNGSSSHFYTKSPGGYPLTYICEALLTIDDDFAAFRDAEISRGRPAIYVFMGDNGMAYGRHGWPQKEVPYATHLPVYFAGNGVAPGASGDLLSIIDIGPTLAAAGGATMPWADGKSFMPILSGSSGGDDYVIEDFPNAGDVGYGQWWGVRTPEWHLIVDPGHWTHLYYLPTDPWEQHKVRNQAEKTYLRSLMPWPR